MKFSFLITPVLISLVATEEIHLAVFSMEGFEKYYLDIRNAKSGSRRRRFGRETVETKADICSAILRSPLFRTRYRCGDPVDLHDSPVYDELRYNYTDFFKNHYIRFHENSVKKRLEFVNPYRLFNATVNESVSPEPVFSCLSRKNSSEDIIQFLVSSQHDINEDTKHNKVTETIMGRFIFRRDAADQMDVIALAQQPALGTTDENESTTEAVEASFRKENESYHEYSSDAMCKLSAFQKIRLCSTIFGSELYRDKFYFLPDADHNEPPCEHLKLYFRHEPYVEGNASKNTDYSNDYMGPIGEWTISCKGVKLENGEPIIRYIIRGSGLRKQGKYNKYYVGVEEIENKTYLESYLYKVGVTLQKFI